MDGISATLRKCCENSKNVRAPGYSVQPVHLSGSLNLNQMSLERNHEDSSEASFSDWNNFKPVAVSGSSLRHCEQLKMFGAYNLVYQLRKLENKMLQLNLCKMLTISWQR
ncbi:hypothetical protein D5086_031295 [Populus alba]|uniref:Uncharacterized protein n=1 Tax=Populus alba TaxID=43335 RepID=A0ACC4AQX7_POPAL